MKLTKKTGAKISLMILLLIILRSAGEILRVNNSAKPPDNYYIVHFLYAMMITTGVAMGSLLLYFYEKYIWVNLFVIATIIFLVVYKLAYLS